MANASVLVGCFIQGEEGCSRRCYHYSELRRFFRIQSTLARSDFRRLFPWERVVFRCSGHWYRCTGENFSAHGLRDASKMETFVQNVRKSYPMAFMFFSTTYSEKITS